MGRKPTVHNNLPKGMRARVRQRKNGSVVTYYFYDTGLKPRREIPLGTDYVLAVKKWAELEVVKLPKAAEATFNLIAERYEKEVIPLKNSVATQRNNLSQLRWLRRFFGNPNAPLSQIEPIHIRQYLDWRKSVKDAANNEITLFGHIWNKAREWGYTDRLSPTLGVKKYAVAKREVYVEDHIYQAIYSVASQDLKDLMDTAYLTGQRPADVVKIHSDHIHEGVLHIRQQKTKAYLRFEVSGRLKEIIDRRLHGKGFLFTNKRGGRLTSESLADWFKDLRDAAAAVYPALAEEIQKVQFRDLRAKAGTDLALAHGKSAAREQLGHTTEAMTSRYIRRGNVLKPLDEM